MKKNALTALLVFSVITGQLEAAPVWWNNMTDKLQSIPGGIARKWHCLKNPDQYNCTPQERTSAKIWITGAATATVLTALTAVGITANAARLSELQKEAHRKANLKLFISIIHESVDKVKQALNEGADPNYRSAIGPMLDVAADKRNSEIVQILLEKGAVPFLPADVQRETSVDIRRMVAVAPFKR